MSNRGGISAENWGFRWPDPGRLPQNHRAPAFHRLLLDDDSKPAGKGDLARSPELALVEAALFAADEPLTLKRLAAVTGIKDIEEVRMTVRQLDALYEKGGSA